MNAKDLTKTAPRAGCQCAVCQWVRRRVAQETDLAANYEAYQKGELYGRDWR